MSDVSVAMVISNLVQNLKVTVSVMDVHTHFYDVDSGCGIEPHCILSECG